MCPCYFIVSTVIQHHTRHQIPFNPSLVTVSTHSLADSHIKLFSRALMFPSLLNQWNPPAIQHYQFQQFLNASFNTEASLKYLLKEVCINFKYNTGQRKFQINKYFKNVKLNSMLIKHLFCLSVMLSLLVTCMKDTLHLRHLQFFSML